MQRSRLSNSKTIALSLAFALLALGCAEDAPKRDSVATPPTTASEAKSRTTEAARPTPPAEPVWKIELRQKMQQKVRARTSEPKGKGNQPPPAWVRKIWREFDRRVAFKFVDAPLGEALRFLQDLTDADFVLDPHVMRDAKGNKQERPVNLWVTDMRFANALTWIIRLADLDYVIKDESIFISTPERLAGEPRRFSLSATQQPEDETWKQELHQQFRKKVSFYFIDTPLVEALKFLQDHLTQANFILDSKAFNLSNKPITLEVTNMPLGVALQRILAPLGLDYTLEDEAVFISRARR